MPQVTLRTPRLVLQPLQKRDLDALHDLFTEPGVREFLWDGEIIPRSQTEDVLEKNEALFKERGFGLWGARVSPSSRLLGFCGFWYFREPPELELLYGLSASEWSRGLATEMATHVIEFGFEALGFTRIAASTDAPNHASVRVLEKCGMQQTGREMIGGLDTIYFSIDRPRMPKQRPRNPNR